MSSLVLYRVIASPPARSVMMLADVLRLQLEYRDVKLLQGEHKGDEFKKMNPMGTVPVLKDGDFVLSESHAILKYLLGTYGEEHRERLYPSETKARALIDQCMFFNSGYFFPRLSAVITPTLAGSLSGLSSSHVHSIEQSYDAVEAYVRARSYVAGSRLTLADLSVGSSATAAQVILPIDNNRYPRFADWLQRIGEEPCFKNVNAEGVAFLGKVIKKLWEKNKQESKAKN